MATRRLSLVCGLAGLAAAVLSQPAAAATAQIEVREAGGGPVAKLIYRAAAGERNQIGVYTTVEGQVGCAVRPGRPSGYLIELSNALGEVTRGVATIPGPGCQTVDDPAERPSSVLCPIPDGAGATGPLLELGDRNDFASLSSLSGENYLGAVVKGEAETTMLGAAGWWTEGPARMTCKPLMWGERALGSGAAREKTR